MVTLQKNTFRNQNFKSLGLIVIAMLFLMVMPKQLDASEETSASEVKAAWINTLLDWIEWKNLPKNSKSVICTIGRDKVYMYLKRIEMSAKSKSADKFMVKNKAPEGELKECNVLYISESEQEYYMNILEKIADSKGIVTVSSIGGFAKHGGAIEFVIRKKASLIINMTTIRKAKVVLDEELYGWVETVN